MTKYSSDQMIAGIGLIGITGVVVSGVLLFLPTDATHAGVTITNS